MSSSTWVSSQTRSLPASYLFLFHSANHKRMSPCSRTILVRKSKAVGGASRIKMECEGIADGLAERVPAVPVRVDIFPKYARLWSPITCAPARSATSVPSTVLVATISQSVNVRFQRPQISLAQAVQKKRHQLYIPTSSQPRFASHQRDSSCRRVISPTRPI